ncbi:MAG: DUF1223 domain-containing protein [Terriglobales bacterium]
MRNNVAIIFLLLTLAIPAVAAEPASTAAPVPVVIELFTSEGCSSCPPADALLMSLDRDSVPGAEIIALGEHVDYWDGLGWKDRFSSAEYTRRQESYAAQFRINSPYTPQIVMNGRAQFSGNDGSRVARAIQDAVRTHHPAPSLLIQPHGEAVDIAIENAGSHRLDVILAVTESDLSTQVGRGENHGRLLRHTAVVRELRKIGKISSGQFTARRQLTLKPDWRRENLRAVVFLQDPSTLEITAAAQTALK